MTNPIIDHHYGTKSWRNAAGDFHREDGPAYEGANGYKSWWIDGQRHREDGPAIECADGNKEWYLNGHLHRDDGPAVEDADGTKLWWINGEELSKNQSNTYMESLANILNTND